MSARIVCIALMLATVSLAGASSGTAGQTSRDLGGIEAPPDYSALPRHVVNRFDRDYGGMAAVYTPLVADVRAFLAQCGTVRVRTDEENRTCASRKVQIEGRAQPYVEKLTSMKQAVAAARRQFPLASYRATGRAFIGGLTATGGFYANPAMSANQQAGQRDLYRQQLLRTVTKDPKAPALDRKVLDLDTFEFALGMATSPEVGRAELSRAVADDVSDGRWSRFARENYPSMIGRDFDALVCHSNGAMLCQVALTHGDIAARSVTLWGPQITKSALAEWQKLLDQRWVESVHMKWTDRDIVPIASYQLSAVASPHPLTASVPAVRSVVEFAIQIEAPSIVLRSAVCPDRSGTESVPCHAATYYQQLFPEP